MHQSSGPLPQKTSLSNLLFGRRIGRFFRSFVCFQMEGQLFQRKLVLEGSWPPLHTARATPKVLQGTISRSCIARQRRLWYARHESDPGSAFREIQSRSPQNSTRIPQQRSLPTKKQVRRRRAHSIRRPIRQEHNAAKETSATEASVRKSQDGINWFTLSQRRNRFR